MNRTYLRPVDEEVMPRLHVKMKILDDRIAEQLPKYATKGSAAMDLYAAIPETLSIAPGETVAISTGMAVWVQHPGYVALMFPRSGLGSKGLVLANTIGVIDSDYQGELKIVLRNQGAEAIVIEPLTRVAQLLLTAIQRADWSVVEDFEAATDRGEGGFGSTGLVA